jgi:heme/copper-type cytochrome/quinol oxidase subunit 1
VIRLELATPAGDFVSDETYNKLFTMHGVMMVFFFLIPAIPSSRQLLVPIMIGTKDLAFPKLNLLSCKSMLGGLFTMCARERRRGHGLDLLHAVQHRLVDDERDPRGPRNLHHGVSVI